MTMKKLQFVLALITIVLTLWFVYTSPWFDLTPETQTATMEIVDADEPYYVPEYEQNNAELWSNVPAFGEVEARECFDDQTAAYTNIDFSQVAIVCVLPDGYGIIYTDQGTVVSTDTVSLTTQAEMDVFMQALGYSR